MFLFLELLPVNLIFILKLPYKILLFQNFKCLFQTFKIMCGHNRQIHLKLIKKAFLRLTQILLCLKILSMILMSHGLLIQLRPLLPEFHH